MPRPRGGDSLSGQGHRDSKVERVESPSCAVGLSFIPRHAGRGCRSRAWQGLSTSSTSRPRPASPSPKFTDIRGISRGATSCIPWRGAARVMVARSEVEKHREAEAGAASPEPSAGTGWVRRLWPGSIERGGQRWRRSTLTRNRVPRSIRPPLSVRSPTRREASSAIARTGTTRCRRPTRPANRRSGPWGDRATAGR